MLLKSCLVAIACLTLSGACSNGTALHSPDMATAEANDEAMIAAVITAQQDAWNNGDIDGYMQGYWKSPDLRFASGGTVVRGWQPTRDRYAATYASRELMGELSLSNLEIILLGQGDDAVVHGAWALKRANDAPSGLFTLVFRKVDGDWKIISDTTTSAS